MRLLGGLGSGRFSAYLACNGAAFVAAWMHRLAIGWIVWERTGSGLWLGLLALCDLGPALVFGPLGGVLGDRGHPERVIAWAQGVVIADMLAMGAAAWLGAPTWALLVLAAIGGGAVATADAARAAIVSALVPADRVGPAVSLNAVAINIARFVGPALAGAIATVSDVLVVFPVAAAISLPLLVFAARSRIERPTSDRPSRRVLRDLADGVSYARHHPLIALVLVNFFAACVFARAGYELMPGLADALFGRGVGGVSAMTTAIGLGAVGAGLSLTGRLSSPTAARAAFLGAVLGGGAAAALALISSFAAALAACAVLGFAISLCGISSQIVVQVQARDDMLNRVLSLWSMIIRAAPALGSLAVGALADVLGFRIPLAATGVLGLLAGVLCWGAFRRRSAKAA